MPKISVIIPFYKCEKYFSRCLESIVNQTYTNLEILLIDDCGKDNCINIAEKFASCDTRIKILHNAVNKGQGYSRNLGIKEATGSYIAFVDADDWLEPTMYEKLIQKAELTNCDIVKCGFNLVYRNKTTEYDFYKCFNEDKIYNVVDDAIKILGKQYNSIWNGIYKTNFLVSKNIYFDEINKFEDMYMYWQSAILANSISYITEPLYNYVKYNENSDTNQLNKIKFCVITNLENIKELIKSYEYCKPAYQIYAYNMINWILKISTNKQKQEIIKRYKKCLKDLDLKEYLQNKTLFGKLRTSFEYLFKYN